MPATREEYADYCHQMVRLQLWFLCAWLSRHPEDSFATAIRLRVGIGRFLDFWPESDDAASVYATEPWLDLEYLAETIFRRADGLAHPDHFEQEAFELYRPAIDRRSAVDWNRDPDFSKFQCGSLRYAKSPADRPRCVDVHIVNRLRPRSIFEDPRYLAGCLTDLMEKSAAEFNADLMSVASWLNSHPKWLELFPAEFVASLTPITDTSGRWLGHWGQFINSCGLFNSKLGQQMRQTGHFPYPRRTGTCGFESLRKHLSRLT